MPARAKTWVTCAPLALGVPSPKSQITCEPGGISALSSKGTGTPETVVRSLGGLGETRLMHEMAATAATQQSRRVPMAAVVYHRARRPGRLHGDPHAATWRVLDC